MKQATLAATLAKDSTMTVTVVGTPNADKTLHVISINPANHEKSP